MQQPLKVLHFTTSVGAGGAETMLCNVLEGMRGSCENIVVSTTSSGHENSLRQRMERNARFYDLESRTLRSPKAFFGFVRILRNEQPAVVHTWMHTAGLFAGVLAKLMGVPVVIWAIHSERIERPERRRAVAERLLAWGAKFLPRRIISCSRSAMTTHETLGYPSGKMVWVGNGIDVERFRPDSAMRRETRERLGIPLEAPVVGYMGRSAPVKDLPTLFKAVAIFQTRHPAGRVICCGLESEQAEVREACEGVPDPGRLHFAGVRTDPERVYPAFDVSTLTSVSEAYPMVLIEAMACGVPCVSTDVGDARAILGETGRVVPVGDAEALAGAWEELLELEPQRRESLKCEARQRAVREFSLDTCVNRYREIYEEALGRKGVAA